MDFRVMAFRFGNLGHAVDELDSGLEVLDVPLFFQPEAVLAYPPALERPEGLRGFLAR